MFKKLWVAIVMLSSVQSVNAATAVGFTESDWAGVPVLGEVSVDEVMELFAGPVEKNGRQWTLASFNNDELKEVIKDNEFEVRQLIDEDLFAHQQFNVDSRGVLQYELFLVSKTKTYPIEDEDNEFLLHTRLPVTTQLTAEELLNPIVRAVQSDLTFEEESMLARENMEEYKRTIGLSHARKLLLFIHPDRVDDFSAMLAEESERLE